MKDGEGVFIIDFTLSNASNPGLSNLASMGIYVFNTDFLSYCLREIPEHDFGKNIIARVLGTHKVYAYM